MDKFFREVRKKLYFSRDNDINFPTHIHDDVEIICIFQGSGTAFCDGKRYDLKAGDLFMVFPEQVHSYIDCTPGDYILLVINPSRLLYLENLIRAQLPTSPICQHTPDLAHLLTEALTEFRTHGDSCVVDGLLTAFLGKLFRTVEFQKRIDFRDTTSRILQYCTQHYLEPITTQDLCREFHLSQSHISHIFTRRLKIPFPDYINALRLNKAILLLKESGLNMTQVSDQAGFPTIRTFNRVFRKQFRCSPSEYRQCARQKK